VTGVNGDTAERLRHLMMAALDGEIEDREREELEQHLTADPALRTEWERMERLKEVTSEMEYQAPSNEIWSHYWSSVYSRLERGIGWVLLSIGAVVLISYGGWKIVESLITTTDLPWIIRGAMLAMLAGFVILTVSVVREKLFMRKRNPYKDVVR
jgi:hypothetical protein